MLVGRERGREAAIIGGILLVVAGVSASTGRLLALAGAVGGVSMVGSNEAEARQSYSASLRDDQIQVKTASDRPPTPEEMADLVDAAVGAVPGSIGGPVSFASVLDGGQEATIQVDGNWGLAGPSRG